MTTNHKSNLHLVKVKPDGGESFDMADSLFLLVDFGSTFTKVSCVDIEEEVIVGQSQDYTTVEEDINIGLDKAVGKIPGIDLLKDRTVQSFASSSAAGGLRMVVIGLVPDLTVEAAKRVSLGAGAIIIGTFSFELAKKEIEEIEKLKPDIILLSGGTDGGDKKTIINNARLLASSSIKAPIIVAGNKVVSQDIFENLKGKGKVVYLSDNVMPRLDQLEVFKVREIIREVFVKHIIRAKGISKAQKKLDSIVQPTPEAVLTAATLLSQGSSKESGFGDLIIVDVGGATTDIHSVSLGEPTQMGVIVKGLPEPYAKRTVEGDLGIRYNAMNILNQAGLEYFVGKTGLREQIIIDRVNEISRNVGVISQREEDLLIDVALAQFAVKTAMERHSGFYKQVYTPNGELLVQYGKDLTKVTKVIGCGGIFSNTNFGLDILKSVLYSSENPCSLKPREADLYIDKKYILAHMGVIAAKYPDKALRILKNNLLWLGKV